MNIFFISETGQGMVEYGLILALVALAVIAGLTAFGQGVLGLYDNSIAKMPM